MAAESSKAPSSRSHLIVLLIVALTAIIGTGAVVAWYLGGARAEAPKPDIPAPAQYLALPPPFIVNLEGAGTGPRYLQVEVQLVTREPGAVETLQHHAPGLRARLLMLFAQQTYEGLSTREGKEALQESALEEVQALMIAETGQPQAEALLFTSFVTQ